MSSSSKAPKGLKDSECKKGSVGVRPPIPYVPPMDLLQMKDNTDNLKVKMSNGTIFTMSIFAKGNPEDYLQHMQVVMCLIGQKGLDEQCKATETAKGAFIRPSDTKAQNNWVQRLEFQRDPRR